MCIIFHIFSCFFSVPPNTPTCNTPIPTPPFPICGQTTRYVYQAFSRQCIPFTYTGCNPQSYFNSQQQCAATCIGSGKKIKIIIKKY